MAYRFIRFPEGKSKAVTFSYDDGSKQDKRLAGTLDRYGIKCTFNLNSSRLLDGTELTLGDSEELIQNGHEVAVHGKHHVACGISSPIEGIKDVLSCREELETALGRIIRGMAYADCGVTRFANGTDYATVKKYLTDLGIAYARTIGGDNDRFELPADWHAWMPTAHHGNPEVMNYIEKFIALKPDEEYWANRDARLFYLWGHAYEFEHNNNWDLLERICNALGDKDDIWYATNIEIYDYVKAYSSLIWSADSRRVYNPTLTDVYFVAGENFFCVKSSETLTLQQ